jgi:hypothetical protein
MLNQANAFVQALVMFVTQYYIELRKSRKPEQKSVGRMSLILCYAFF